MTTPLVNDAPFDMHKHAVILPGKHFQDYRGDWLQNTSLRCDYLILDVLEFNRTKVQIHNPCRDDIVAILNTRAQLFAIEFDSARIVLNEDLKTVRTENAGAAISVARNGDRLTQAVEDVVSVCICASFGDC